MRQKRPPDKADDTVVVVQDVSEQQDAPQDQTAQPGASDGERSEEAPIAQASDASAPVDPLKDETVPRDTEVEVEVEAGQVAQEPSEPATDPETEEAVQDDEAAQNKDSLAQASTPAEQTEMHLSRLRPCGHALIWSGWSRMAAPQLQGVDSRTQRS